MTVRKRLIGATTLVVMLASVLALPVASRSDGAGEAENLALGSQTLCENYSGLPAGWPDKFNAGMVHIAAGAFVFGSTRGYLDERPASHEKTQIHSFWIDQTEVTNAQFAAFVRATGYTSDAERQGGGAVFHTPSDNEMVQRDLAWWTYVKGASWRHPLGPGSTIAGKVNQPVTLVTRADALAFAHWLGRDLPTEAEWEYAAKAGHEGADLDVAPYDDKGKPAANYWQGPFPTFNTAEDGHDDLAPVGCYGANDFKLFDTIGNAWEWTKDIYTGPHQPHTNGDTAEIMPASRKPNIRGEIDTPNLDALAAQGRVLTNFHTGAKCQVTRSQLLTGTEHHLIGQGTMGSNPNDPRFGKPGYENYLNDSALTFVQLLNDAGYHTYMSGKWQLGGTSSKGDEGESPGGRRPQGWGFERTLIPSGGSHVHYIDPSNQTPGAEIEVFSKDGKYTAADYSGKSQYSADLFTRELIRQIDLDHGDKKPFFAYLAFNTPHVPMEAPDADLEKYKGRYKEGFNVVRENRIDKQKKLGIIPQDFTPTSLASKWKDLSPVQKQVFERRMQVYAAMVDNLDQNVGLIVQHLKEIGEYDNTFIVFQSDNGAPDSNDKFANITTEGDDLTLVITKLGRLGIGKLPEFRRSPEWASVSNTPFRGFKTELYEGGVSTPAIFVLPGQKEKLPALHEFAHVTDFAPTVLELAGVTPPSEQAQPDVVHVDAGQEGKLSKVLYQGKAVYPVTGTSLLGWLKGEKNGAIHSDPQVDEFDSQIYVNKGEWKALWQPLIIKKEKSTVEGWKLFNVASDRGETTALNANHPETLKELIEAWQGYATRVGVVSYGDVWPPKAADLK